MTRPLWNRPPLGMVPDRRIGRCTGCGHVRTDLDVTTGCCPTCNSIDLAETWGLAPVQPVGEFAPTVEGRLEFERRRAA